MIRLKMKNYSMILQEEAKILALLSGKIDTDEDLAGEEIL